MREEERRRIARDLHDGAAQLVGAARLEVERLRRAFRSGALREADFETLGARLDEAWAELRGTLVALRAPALREASLGAALRAAVADFSQRTGIRARFEERGEGPPLSSGIEDQLYAIAREALENVARHAGARSVAVALARGARAVSLSVEDDGRGFVAGARPGGFGVAGIRERAALAGGEARISSRRGRGTRVEVTIPLPRRPRKP